MAVAPFPIQCVRGGKWVTIQTDELLPGDVVSVGETIFTFSLSLAFLILP